jgi:hypothetical protein
MLIINGLGLSRRVVRNRGLIDFWEGGGKELIELELILKINHRRRRQLRPGGNPGTWPIEIVEWALIDSIEAVRSTALMYCVHKAGGWQPKAAGGWFALLT